MLYLILQRGKKYLPSLSVSTQRSELMPLVPSPVEKAVRSDKSQSINRQAAGIVLHFFSLFLPGIFLPLTGGAASMPTVERGAPFLSAEIPPSLLCSGILFIPGAFLTLNSPCILSQPQTGRGAPPKKVSSCRRQKSRHARDPM